MSNKYSRINLGIKLSVNYIIGLILWNFIVKQYSTVIKFCYFRFSSLTVNLDLFGINLGSTSKPCFCYP